jgi:hypothetical protein
MQGRFDGGQAIEHRQGTGNNRRGKAGAAGLLDERADLGVVDVGGVIGVVVRMGVIRVVGMGVIRGMDVIRVVGMRVIMGVIMGVGMCSRKRRVGGRRLGEHQLFAQQSAFFDGLKGQRKGRDLKMRQGIGDDARGNTEIDEGGQGHVAGDARETVDVEGGTL